MHLLCYDMRESNKWKVTKLSIKSWCLTLLNQHMFDVFLKADTNNFHLHHLPESITKQMERYGFDFYVVIDQTGVIRYISTSAAMYLPKHALEATYIFQILHHDSYSVIETYLDNHLTQDIVSGEKVKMKSKASTSAEVRSFCLNRLNGLHLLSFHSITLDNNHTHLTRHTERLISLGEMSARLVHEFKNPITSLRGFIELIRAGVPYEEEYYQVIGEELKRMDRLTHELLSFAKPQHQDWELMTINSICQDMTILFRQQLLTHKIQLTIDLTDNLHFLGNRCQMKQVFINLIKNAIEAMEDEGSIFITGTHDTRELHVTIKDTGPGIPHIQLSNIMEAFFTTKQSGTGLGLNMYKKIVEDHHGKLIATSKLNEGTIFTLSLPYPDIQTLGQIS